MDPIRYQTPDELKAFLRIEGKALKSFFESLKRKKPKNLDELFFQLHNEAFEQFDCLDCANCCSSISPIVTNRDIERLAKYEKARPSDLIDKYFRVDEDQDYVFRQAPCPYLMADNYCAAYDSRPKACHEYPHTDRRKMYQILNLTFKNCEICPVVLAIALELRNRMS